MVETTTPAMISRKANTPILSPRRAVRSGAVSMPIPKPRSSGCEKLSETVPSLSSWPAIGFE